MTISTFYKKDYHSEKAKQIIRGCSLKNSLDF